MDCIYCTSCDPFSKSLLAPPMRLFWRSCSGPDSHRSSLSRNRHKTIEENFQWILNKQLIHNHIVFISRDNITSIPFLRSYLSIFCILLYSLLTGSFVQYWTISIVRLVSLFSYCYSFCSSSVNPRYRQILTRGPTLLVARTIYRFNGIIRNICAVRRVNHLFSILMYSHRLRIQ